MCLRTNPVYIQEGIQIISTAKYIARGIIYLQFSSFYMMGTFLFLLFLILHAIANESSLMSPKAPEDTLASSVFLPADSLAQIPGTYFSVSAWKSGKFSQSEPGLEQTSTEVPELPILAGNDIAICNSRIEKFPGQIFVPSRFRQSLARFNKRRIPEFCSAQPTDQPVVAPQNLGEGSTSDPLTPSPEVSGPRIPGKANSASPKEPLNGPASAEEMRALINLFPGTDGVPNPDECSILLKPLHKVPICALPHPTRDFFADAVSPARLWKRNDRCHLWTEERWCCVMARESYYFEGDRAGSYPATGFDCILVQGAQRLPMKMRIP